MAFFSVSVRFLVLFLLFQLNDCYSGEEVMCIGKERQALLSFKEGLILVKNGSLRTNISSWGNEEDEKDCCKWSGVTCNDQTGHVVGLDLVGGFLQIKGNNSNNSLAPLLELHQLFVLDMSQLDFMGSKIPEILGSFKKLEYLRLSDSNLTGNIPYQLMEMTNLIQLDLSQNQLTGAVPDHKFVSLKILRLDHNNLTNLPKSIGSLTELERLDVCFNPFLNGTITEADLSKLHKLKVLCMSFVSLHLAPEWIPPFQLKKIRLANCKIGPRFPAWLQTQSNFNYIDLSFNSISDEVPNWFWDLSQQMTYLNLSNNDMSGLIPDLSSNFIAYPEVDVSYNKFWGPLPLFHSFSEMMCLSNNLFSGSIQSICRFTYYVLGMLDLSNNQFSGELPNCWENMTALIVLNLNNNYFSGELPQTLGSLTSLRNLQFRNNNLSGDLPSTLRYSSLRLVDGGGNNLTGLIPAWMARLTGLAFLNLRQNNFYGSIPAEICQLTGIQVLDLSQNNISGTIPLCFENFTSLVLKNKSANDSYLGTSLAFGYGWLDDFNYYVDNTIVQWKRQKFEYRKTLRLLKLIDLSSNKLVGNIPNELFNLKALDSLNLSRNYLTGKIPPNIDEMEMLEVLDISTNQLSGAIPDGLAQLNSLAVLDLSNNNLSGMIPLSAQLQSFDPSAFAGNNRLCGDPLPKCTEDAITTVHHGHTSMPESPYTEYYIAIIFGFIFGFWGIIGPLMLKKSWANAYFGSFSKIAEMCTGNDHAETRFSLSF